MGVQADTRLQGKGWKSEKLVLGISKTSAGNIKLVGEPKKKKKRKGPTAGRGSSSNTKKKERARRANTAKKGGRWGLVERKSALAEGPEAIS